MTEQDTIKINKMAINAINLDEENPKISESLFPVEERSSVIKEFFNTHYSETRNGKSTKSCKFIDDDATVKTKVNRFSNSQNDEGFLKLSGELTQNLFNTMKNSSSTSSGTFFVCDVHTETEKCIFIIKLDPKNGVQVDYNNLTVRVLENILPDSNDRVHKCAIIRYESSDTDAELFVMDKQQREGEPARFFIETYLQAAELLNDKIMTKDAIKDVRKKVLNIVPEADENEVNETVDRVFSNGNRVQLKTAVSNILEDYVSLDKEDREIFIKNESDNFVDEYLEKHPDHQTNFVVERSDSHIVYKAKKDQVYLRYNEGIKDKVSARTDENGNMVITIDKDLGLKRMSR